MSKHITTSTLAIGSAETGVTAATLKQLSETSPVPYLNIVAGVSLLILKTVQDVKKNKEECAAFLEQIDQLLLVILQLCSEPAAVLPPGIVNGIGKFAEILQKIEVFMRMQQGAGRLKRFWRQHEDRAQLEDCKAGLKEVFEVFSTKINVSIAKDLADIKLIAEQRHPDLLDLISDDNDGYSMGSTSSLRTLDSNGSISSLTSLLPSLPQIFHGREFELTAIIQHLMQNTPRVAILGTGGIGKTSLAKAALHHPSVVAKYPDRYFVSCDSCVTVEDLVFAIATGSGLELTGVLSKTIIPQLCRRSSCLMILDNFETPWEPLSFRSTVEEFLSLLTDVEHVALVVTMRGQERPLNIRWTRPFVPPLKPLNFAAARNTFIDISDLDSNEDASDITELLSLTGNLPLAVTLMASAASVEGCKAILTRWKTESVSILSDGLSKETNLETSLRMSLSSPRITSSPGALELLSVLSLLPDGILDLDLLNCPIQDLLQSKSTLLRTALAYEEARRMKVLAPVRELIRRITPPSYTLVHPLRLHWAGIFDLWQAGPQTASANITQWLTENSGNIASLLKYGLEIGAPDLKEQIYEIFQLNSFSGKIYGCPSFLMDDIAAKIELADDNKLRGHYIHNRFTLFETSITPAEAPSFIARGRKFYQLAGDLKAESVFIATIVKYYMRQAETNKASLYAGISLDLAEQADDNVCRYHALCAMAMCTEAQGKFRATLELAQKAQWLATRIGNFQHETIALIDEAAAWIGLGNFSEAVRLCGYGRQLVVAAGLEGSQHEIQILDLEAKVHVQKTAYAEGRRVYEQILRLSTREKFALFHGHSLVSIASIDVDLGMFHSEAELLAALEIPRQIYTARGYLHGLPECDRVLAAFYLADGRIQEAMQMYEKSARSLRGESGDELCLCLLKLGDITLCTSVRSATHWATSYLAYGMTTSSPSDTSWAFRLLADIFWIQGDEKTSRVLFQVALEEFTRMDIHLGKAQCLIRLAELAETRGSHRLAAEHFSDARCMLLKSGYGVVQTEKALGAFNQAHRESLMLEPSPKAPAPSSNVINAMERVVAPM